MDFEYKMWQKKYFTKKVLKLKETLTEKEISILEKLGYHVEDKKYTEAEFDTIDNSLYDYWISEEKIENNDVKPLPEDVSQEEYLELMDKFYSIAAANF